MKKRWLTLVSASLACVMWATISAKTTTVEEVVPDVTPVYNLFTFEVTDEVQPAFYETGYQNFTQSLANEPGTWVMNAGNDKTNNQLVYVAEVYENKKAYEAHKKSPQYNAFVDAVGRHLNSRAFYSLEPVALLTKEEPLQLVNEDTVLVNLAKVTVKSGYNDDFARIVVAEMKQSIATEPGVLAMYAGRVKGDRNTWYFFEVYANEDAYAKHRNTWAFKWYISETKDMVLEKFVTPIEAKLIMHKGQVNYEAIQ